MTSAQPIASWSKVIDHTSGAIPHHRVYNVRHFAAFYLPLGAIDNACFVTTHKCPPSDDCNEELIFAAQLTKERVSDSGWRFIEVRTIRYIKNFRDEVGNMPPHIPSTGVPALTKVSPAELAPEILEDLEGPVMSGMTGA
jgi:hypothetical protein